MTSIVLDGKAKGRLFEGVGALSAGASSRLLMEYPEPQRSEILDFLFKPNFGASLHHLKVEIGGDVNSTDGCEPSHMHTRDDGTYSRGYEWWLMKEAKARNPDILLDALEWGAPGWIGGGKFFSQDNADYIVKFIQGNRRVHGLDIDYVGIWNERAYDTAWIKRLRQTLDRHGLGRVKIVAADEVNAWKIAEDMAADAELAKAVAVVGSHYTGFASTEAARALGHPLWDSEDGPWSGEWDGARRLARMYNRNYITGRMTKTITWSLVTSYYDNLRHPGSGLMMANTPWSGAYEVQPAVWVAAHTAQFAKPGWIYLDSGCVLMEGGSGVALMAPDGQTYSVIVETTEAKETQNLEFRLAGGLPESRLHVWRSTATESFARVGDITPVRGAFVLAAEPDCIYSLTCTTGQGKGAATPPPARPFPRDYDDDFESYPVGGTARYAMDQAGIFEVVARADGKGKALRQIVPARGIEWVPNPYPETVLGSGQWTDYNVSVDALIERAGFVSLFGRVGKIKKGDDPPEGYWLKVGDSGQWELSVTVWVPPDDKSGTCVRTTLAEGRVPFSADTWHNLKLDFSGPTIGAWIDGAPVATVRDSACAAGRVGIGCGWHPAQFDNLSVRGKQ